MKEAKFVDPSLLAQMGSLYLVAKTVAQGAIGGFHRSPYLGSNAEFSHHKEYQPGDQIKHIDWKRYAKTSKFYIKQYEESSSLNAFILLDDSASMHCHSSKGLSKSLYSKFMITSLAWLLLHQRDGLGFLSFCENIHQFLPISTKKTRFSELIKLLESPPLSKKTSLLKAVEKTLPLLKQRSMIILVSDFLENEKEVLEAIKMLRYYKHEVLAFHILSYDDLYFPHKDFALFEDSETGSSLGIEGKVASKLYQENLKEFLSEIKSSMTQLGVDYNLFDTSIPIEKALIHYLYKRSRFL